MQFTVELPTNPKYDTNTCVGVNKTHMMVMNMSSNETSSIHIKWSKPLLIGTKLGNTFSHTTEIMCPLWSKNVGKVDYAGNGGLQ
jgi:hypothetical protein